MSIWQSEELTAIEGVSGTITTNWKSYLKNYGIVWYSNQMKMNILSLKDESSKFKVMYTTDNDSVFIIHKPDGTMNEFKMNEHGLHVMAYNIQVQQSEQAKTTCQPSNYTTAGSIRNPSNNTNE